MTQAEFVTGQGVRNVTLLYYIILYDCIASYSTIVRYSIVYGIICHHPGRLADMICILEDPERPENEASGRG